MPDWQDVKSSGEMALIAEPPGQAHLSLIASSPGSFTPHAEMQYHRDSISAIGGGSFQEACAM